MMAILSEPSGVKSFPDKPRLNKPALKAFTVEATSVVAYFFKRRFLLQQTWLPEEILLTDVRYNQRVF
jgi:hypothetical protein